MDVSTLPVSAEDTATATKRDSTLAAGLQQVRLGHWPVQPSDDLVQETDGVVVMGAYCEANESSDAPIQVFTDIPIIRYIPTDIGRYDNRSDISISQH